MARDSTADQWEGDERGGRPPLDRRGYLRLSAGVAAGAAVGAGAGAGAGSARGADRTVDVIDAGADATGAVEIDDTLTGVAADDTRLVFRAGTYRVDDVTLRGYEGLELIAPDGATLLFAGGTEGGLALVDCADVAIEGFDTDAAVSRVEAAVPETPGPVNTVEFAAGDGAVATYGFTVDGDLLRRPTDVAATSAATDVFGRSAEGALSADVVTFEYTGAITDFRLSGDAAVTINGRAIGGERLDRPSRPTELTVDGGSDHAVDGDAEPVDADASANPDADVYRLAGALASLHVAGEATVTLARI